MTKVETQMLPQIKRISLSSLWIVSLIFVMTAQGEMLRSDSQEVVLDTDTNLLWQDNSDTKTLKKNWQDAIDYCKNLNLHGIKGWQLPERSALKDLVDKNKGFSDAGFYWSSSSGVSGSIYAWGVYVYSGGDGTHDRSYSFFVRCVRAGQ